MPTLQSFGSGVVVEFTGIQCAADGLTVYFRTVRADEGVDSGFLYSYVSNG